VVWSDAAKECSSVSSVALRILAFGRSITKRKEIAMNTLTTKEMEIHVAVTGWLQIANSLLSIVAGAFVLVLLVGVGVAVEDEVALRIMAATGLATGGLLLILSLPGLVAGLGLLRRASWSRIMAQVLAVFELVLFPIGTLLGAYTIFVLSQRAAPEVFGACCALEESRLQGEGA
jgi:hypothetical protein